MGIVLIEKYCEKYPDWVIKMSTCSRHDVLAKIVSRVVTIAQYIAQPSIFPPHGTIYCTTQNIAR